MREVLLAAACWAAAGVGCGRATVVRTIGSSPFPIGSTLVAADDGRLAGSVSAGCVEGAAAAAIIAARKGRYRELVRYGVTGEQAVEPGLACGGAIEVLVEPEIPPEALAAAIGNQAVAIASHLPVGRETSTISRVVIERAGRRSGSLRDAASDAELAVLAQTALDDGTPRTVRIGEAELFIDVVMPAPRLIIVGAGEIAVHLVRLAHAFGFWTTVVDARSAWATRERFPDADELLLGWADELADGAGIDADAYVVTLAHDAKFDDPALLAALTQGSRYVGALGSRRTHAARIARLRAAGLSERQLARIHAPVGLDLGGHDPADIALGILAEIAAERNRLARPDREAADGRLVSRPAI